MQAPQVRVQILLYLAIHVNHINFELSSNDSAAIFGLEASQFHDGGRREAERPRMYILAPINNTQQML